MSDNPVSGIPADTDAITEAAVGAQLAVRCRRAGFTLNAAFTPPDRGVTALFGPSASGKTLLLRCLAGLETTATIAGRSFGQATGTGIGKAERGAGPVRGRTGYVFQDDRLFPHLDVRSNLEFASKRAPSGSAITVTQAMDWLGLAALGNRLPTALSGGERRRVAIARALVNGPEVLLLDEPLNGLDRTARQQILQLLQQLVRKLEIPILYVSHQIEEIIQLADRVLLMEAGSIVAEGGLVEILGRLDLGIDGESGPGSILEGRVIGHEPGYGLTDLEIGHGVVLSVQKIAAGEGSQHRLLVHARDVSLTREKAGDSSILNILPVTLSSMKEIDAFSVLVRVRAGEQFLLAKITRKSWERLGLTAVDTFYAQIKSVSLVPSY